MDNAGKINTTDRNGLPEAERAIPNMVSSADGELEQVAAGIEQVAEQMAQGKTAEEILREGVLQEQSAGVGNGEVVRRSMERGNVAIGAANVAGVENRGYLPGPDVAGGGLGQSELEVQSGLNTGGLDGEGRAIFGGADETSEAGGVNGGDEINAMNEAVVGALEVSEDENRLENAQEFVGEATELQKAEWKAEDLEDLKNENGVGSGTKIVIRSQEQRGAVMGKTVAKFLSKKKFPINDLVATYRKERDAMLLDFENPRVIGGRN